jgi:DeoR/GlpR family transcriptional regulator of sugar metabolism
MYAMGVEDRRREIENLIGIEGELELVQLSDRFKVSEMTIRRDLEVLESRGILRRVVGGGAIALEPKSEEPSLMARALKESEGKAHIGKAVVKWLRDGEAVYLDGGSTALAVARALRESGLRLTVLTRNMFAAIELATRPGIDIIVLGGRLKTTEMVTIGTSLDHGLGNYYVDTYVMGISGVHPERGLTDYDPAEAAGKSGALEVADRVILAFDKTKLGQVRLAHVAGIDKVDVVVTDALPNHPVLMAFLPKAQIDCVRKP